MSASDISVEERASIDDALFPMYNFIFRWVVRPAAVALLLAVIALLIFESDFTTGVRASII